jgi:hypothetical protein
MEQWKLWGVVLKEVLAHLEGGCPQRVWDPGLFCLLLLDCSEVIRLLCHTLMMSPHRPKSNGANPPRTNFRTFCLSWPWTTILPISASLVAGITGVSHHTWPFHVFIIPLSLIPGWDLVLVCHFFPFFKSLRSADNPANGDRKKKILS